MSKTTERVKVTITSEGAVYVDVVDLFKQKKVQELILKLAKLDLVKKVIKPITIVVFRTHFQLVVIITCYLTIYCYSPLLAASI